MRLQKTVAVLTLARALAGSFEGLTLDEMAALVGAGRWTAERIRDAVEAAFEPLEREDDGGRVRFRLAAPSLGNFAAAPTAAEFAELENAARALDASRDAGRAALQRAAKDGIRSVHCSAIAIAWGYDKSDVDSPKHCDCNPAGKIPKQKLAGTAGSMLLFTIRSTRDGRGRGLSFEALRPRQDALG
jgi:predicted DNA-binding transcriptional regulator YafY